MSDTIRLDYESKSEIDLTKRGLDVYSSHPSTDVLLAAWKINNGPMRQWEKGEGPFPREVVEALEDPHVIKRAFNAQFERVISKRVLKIDTPYAGWRCTMVLAYEHSFAGQLADIAQQMGLPEDQQKMKEGKRLVKLFTMPQKVTKAQPFRWRDSLTDPEDWELFRTYNRSDVTVEEGVETRLTPYFIPESEWEMYEIDQEINDRGIPIDMVFVRNAIRMYNIRQRVLTQELERRTGLANTNSVQQLLGWLRERGYWFEDLQKDTVEKVLTIIDEEGREVDPEIIPVLKLRQLAARASVKKYNGILEGVGDDDHVRFGLQFAGAQRTMRWAGRKPLQPHNMAKTPKAYETDLEGSENDPLVQLVNIIRSDDYDMLEMFTEPMEALGGGVRSVIRAPEGYELRPRDLASIETAVIAWLTDCKRLLNVFAEKKDPYKDFAQFLFNKPYDAITKAERNTSKPPVLGCGYRLGGGDLIDGKKTGLWGYAENMKVKLTKEESHKAVAIYRKTYVEVPDYWKVLEQAIQRCLSTGQPQQAGKLSFDYKKPFMRMFLPSGRPIYYHKPRLEAKEVQGIYGPYTRYEFSYMGKEQNGHRWVRIYSHGGKTIEQATQATARDVLVEGLKKAHYLGFDLRLHVHDEAVPLCRIGDNYYTNELLGECLTAEIPWAKGLPLGSAGWSGPFYKKD